jgi:hypothetical protein
MALQHLMYFPGIDIIENNLSIFRARNNALSIRSINEEVTVDYGDGEYRCSFGIAKRVDYFEGKNLT